MEEKKCKFCGGEIRDDHRWVRRKIPGTGDVFPEYHYFHITIMAGNEYSCYERKLMQEAGFETTPQIQPHQ